jgi:hypothetical protein
MARGFVYLVAVMDWFSRRVLAWRLSIGMDTDFCVAGVGFGQTPPRDFSPFSEAIRMFEISSVEFFLFIPAMKKKSQYMTLTVVVTLSEC